MATGRLLPFSMYPISPPREHEQLHEDSHSPSTWAHRTGLRWPFLNIKE